MVWFRPYYPGTYRFVDPMGGEGGGQRFLLDRAGLGGVPIHLGTGLDPQVKVRLGSKWEPVGVGCCMPGWDYLYVLVDGPDSGIGMRILTEEGKVLVTRTLSAAGAPVAPGYGPSLRFRAPRPGPYRLEAKGPSRWVVKPLLRRASN
jgi:hypothetical protein